MKCQHCGLKDEEETGMDGGLPKDLCGFQVGCTLTQVSLRIAPRSLCHDYLPWASLLLGRTKRAECSPTVPWVPSLIQKQNVEVHTQHVNMQEDQEFKVSLSYIRRDLKTKQKRS